VLEEDVTAEEQEGQRLSISMQLQIPSIALDKENFDSQQRKTSTPCLLSAPTRHWLREPSTGFLSPQHSCLTVRIPLRGAPPRVRWRISRFNPCFQGPWSKLRCRFSYPIPLRRMALPKKAKYIWDANGAQHTRMSAATLCTVHEMVAAEMKGVKVATGGCKMCKDSQGRMRKRDATCQKQPRHMLCNIQCWS
jgi:hypothetical protein